MNGRLFLVFGLLLAIGCKRGNDGSNAPGPLEQAADDVGEEVEHVEDRAREVAEDLGEEVEHVEERAREVAEDVGEAVDEVVDEVSGRGGSAPQSDEGSDDGASELE